MERVLISQAKKKAQGEFCLAGFVRNLRLLKGLIFIDLVDISGLIQLTIIEKDYPEVFKIAKDLNLESVIKVKGEIQEKPSKKGSENSEPEFEILLNSLELISLAEDNLPIPVLLKIDNEANLEQRLDWRYLDLRQKEQQLIFKVWTKLEEGAREYLLANGFIQLYTPSLMSTSSETGADVFELKYFNKKAYLSQSPQFFKQMAMASGLERVFVFGPVFRAEKSFTSRHTTEFTGWDLELSYLDYFAIMKIQEDLIIAGFEKIKKDLNYPLDVPKADFPKITLAEAKKKLKLAGVSGEKDYDLSTEEERVLGEIIKKEKNHDFVFVIDYPIEARPFYHRRHADQPSLTKSFDLLYKGLEITTGSEREHRFEILKEQALEKNMNLEELKDYLNFFRYGCPNHGGIGMGPARLIMKLLNLNNVKEVAYLPRDVNRLKP